MNVKPLSDKVLVQAIETGKISPGGIHIPPAAEGKPQRAIVIAVGPGRIDNNGKRIPMEVEPGDEVAYGKYTGVEVQVNDEHYIIMPESDILAVVNE